jgi:predicted transposase YdaD
VFVKNDEERRLYELREKGRLEFQNAMFTAERRGEQRGELRGEQRGEQRGELRGRQATARTMLALDIQLELISEISGLSIEEIKALKETSENHNA